MKKKTLSKKLNDLINKAGQANRYQFSLMICFLLQVMCCEMLNISLPSLEATPYVFEKDSQESVRLTYKLCEDLNITKDSKLDERPFDVEKKVTSIVIDYKIYCDSTKVYMISTFFYSGIIIGSSTCYMFADKIGRKKTLITFIPIYICLLILFFLNELLNKNYYLTLIFLFFIGITIYTITITLIIYLCEIIKQKTIPIFLAVVLLGLPLSGMICDLIFYYIIHDWKYILIILAIMNSIVYIIMSFIIVNSPIYFLVNGDVKNFIESIKIIAKINRKTLNKEDYAFLEPFLSENKTMNNIINAHIINNEENNNNENNDNNYNNNENDDKDEEENENNEEN
jgi:MFS family permease